MWDLALAQQANILAAMYAGARSGLGLRALATLERFGTPGEVTSFPDGASRSLFDAVWLHAVLANVLEMDDFVFAGHTGHASVGVPLALGQITNASGEELLLAQIAANEVAGRLGATMMVGPQQGHMKAYVYRAAAAVAAGRLYGLSADELARALAAALANPEYPLFPGAFSPDTKSLAIGEPAVAGVRAAQLAATGGLDVAMDIVEHEVGLVTSLSNHAHAPPVWSRLGETWSTSAICFKPIPSCAYAAAAAICADRIRSGEGEAWSVDRVRDVRVDTSVLSVSLESFSRPHAGELTPSNTHFSLARTVAYTLLAGLPQGSHYTPERFDAHKADIARLSQRVSLHHHWPYTLHMLRGADQAIDHPGRPGIYGMTDSHAVMARFNKAFGSPPAVRLQDIPRLLALGPKDAGYVAMRYARGIRASLPFPGGEKQRRAYVAREQDLRRLAMNLSARVTVTFDDGTTRSSEELTAPGFAGRDDKGEVPWAKLRLEIADALDEQAAATLERLLRGETGARALAAQAPKLSADAGSPGSALPVGA